MATAKSIRAGKAHPSIPRSRSKPLSTSARAPQRPGRKRAAGQGRRALRNPLKARNRHGGRLHLLCSPAGAERGP
jgi:hypothetical protein